MSLGFISQTVQSPEHMFSYSQSDSFDSDNDGCLIKLDDHKNNIMIIKNKKSAKNPFKCFIDGIPTFEYDLMNVKKNEKNKDMKIELKNNRFFNYYEAFLSIAEHCHKNQISFTRDKCKEYLKESYIIDFSRDGFIPITTNLKTKQFNKYYRYAQREMKYF